MSCSVEWCAGGHRCTAPRGEHRSQPQSWRTPYGNLVITRVRRADQTDYVELRVVARLPADQDVARDMARALALGVDVTIRDVLRGNLQRLREAYRRLRGAQPEPGCGGGEHPRRQPSGAQPEPGCGGGEHRQRQPSGAQRSAG